MHDPALAIRIEFLAVGILMPEYVAREIDSHDLGSEADTEVRHLILPCISACHDHTFDPPLSESSRNADPIDPFEDFSAFSLDSRRVDEVEPHLPIVRISSGSQSFVQRIVGIFQIIVFPHHPDHDLLFRFSYIHPKIFPFPQVESVILESEFLKDEGSYVPILIVQRDLVDASDGRGGDDVLLVHGAHVRRLLDDLLGYLLVGPKHEEVRIDSVGLELSDRVLGRLRLELVRCGDVGEERDVQEDDVRGSELVPELPCGLDEVLVLHVSHRSSDLDDHDLRLARSIGIADFLLDQVREVRDDLDRLS